MWEILTKYVSEKELREGTIVDVGANDGLFLNWSLEFEQDGYDVLCIEGNEDHKEALEEHRKDSMIAVISDKNEEETKFYIWESPNTASYTGIILHVNPHINSPKVIRKVKTRTLTSIFEEKGFNQITLLGIDVEGAEHKVLLGLDFDRWSPLFIMVEEQFQYMDQAKKLLLDNGYKFVWDSAGDFIYCKEELCEREL